MTPHKLFVTFCNMRFAKSQICWIRELPRYPGAPQLAALSEHGCGQIFDASKPNARDDMIDQLRRGDVIKVRSLHLLAMPRRRTTDEPRRDLWATIHAIEDRGASVLELATMRSTTNHRERDMMIADAIETITRGARALPRKIARENGKLGGRPPAKISDEQRAAARELWFDKPNILGRNLKKNLLRVGYSVHRCYREFGPRGGRS